MDPLLLAAGSALVAAMATEGWRDARAAAGALWRRIHPDRVPVIEAELTDVRGELLEARDAGRPEIETELAEEWQRRLARLVAADPELVPVLRRTLTERWNAVLPPEELARLQSINQSATASDEGRVFQAGRDQFNTGI